MSGLLYQVRELFGEEVIVCRADVARTPDTVAEQGIRGIPTIQVHHRGRRVASYTGQIKPPDVVETVEAILPQ